MLSVKQIQQVWKYAKDFKVDSEGVISPCLDFFRFEKADGFKSIQSDRFKTEIYPLFLQAVIDGVNREAYNITIRICDTIIIYDSSGYIVEEYESNSVSVRSREAAIKYLLSL